VKSRQKNKSDLYGKTVRYEKFVESKVRTSRVRNEAGERATQRRTHSIINVGILRYVIFAMSQRLDAPRRDADGKNDVAGAVEFAILLITELGELESDFHIDYDDIALRASSL